MSYGFLQRIYDQWIALTLSLGAASLPQLGQTSEELLTMADAAMYQAKYSGRNRTCMATDIKQAA